MDHHLIHSFRLTRLPTGRGTYVPDSGTHAIPAAAGMAAPATLALTRRQARAKLAAHRATLTVAELDQLEVDDSEWMTRLCRAGVRHICAGDCRSVRCFGGDLGKARFICRVVIHHWL